MWLREAPSRVSIHVLYGLTRVCLAELQPRVVLCLLPTQGHVLCPGKVSACPAGSAMALGIAHERAVAHWASTLAGRAGLFRLSFL